MPACNKCHADKDDKNFAYTLVRGQYYRRKICRECINDQCKSRYFSDHDANKAKTNNRYSKVGRFKRKKDYDANPSKFREIGIKRNASLEGRAYNMWKNARLRSGSDFNIPREYISAVLTKGVCERSGIRFDLSIATHCKVNRFAPSIDKIDRSKGYIMGNIQIVVWCYNTGKGEATDEQFLEFCKAVVNAAAVS